MMRKFYSLAIFGAFFALPAHNDLFYSRQWALHNDGTGSVEISRGVGLTDKIQARAGIDIGWEEAQTLVKRAKLAPVIVAVIDSGLDVKHEDLSGRIAEGGQNFLADTGTVARADVTDEVGHGTHVAGIIAANADNKLGIAGAAPSSVKILPLKVYRGVEAKLPLSQLVAQAIRYAVAQHARVINMSLSWTRAFDSADARTAVKEALDAGVLIFASAGNDHKKEPTYPCSYDGVICAGAVSIDGSVSVYSDYGSHIDLLGPGDDVVSTYPTTRVSSALRFQKYELLSGTSQASPYLAAIAATVWSVEPGLPSREVKARLLASAQAAPAEGVALYGLARMDRALTPVAGPVYYPHFKELKPATVDEGTLKVGGEVLLENIGVDSPKARVETYVNDALSSAVDVDAIASGGFVALKWGHVFTDLNEPSVLKLTIKVIDALGEHRFDTHIETARSLDRMATVRHVKMERRVTGIDFKSTWYQVKRGVVSSALIPILNYGKPQTGAPIYFQSLDTETGRIAIIDTAKNNGINRVTIPFVYGVGQILRLDANQDGIMDYVALGFGTYPNGGTYLQFCFMDQNFNPLWKSQSAWQIPVTNKSSILLHSYSTPGSWIQWKGRLLPAMIATGTLPDEDNYPLSLARFQSAKHLYVLEPDESVKNDNPQILALKIRAVDNSDFRGNKKANAFNIETFAPMTDDELARGEARVITSQGRGLGAKLQFLTVMRDGPTFTDTAAGWDLTSFGGKLLDVLPAHSAAYVHFLDADKAQIDWFDRDRTARGRSAFDYSAPLDPISNAIGAFDFGERGKYWFVDSRFGLIGYFAQDQWVTHQELVLERDAYYDGIELNAMYSPVLVGSSVEPQAGVFIDSTAIRGDRVKIITYHPKSGLLGEPLRYSFQVPEGCMALKPYAAPTVQSKNNYALTLQCQGAEDIEFKSVDLSTDL